MSWVSRFFFLLVLPPSLTAAALVFRFQERHLPPGHQTRKCARVGHAAKAGRLWVVSRHLLEAGIWVAWPMTTAKKNRYVAPEPLLVLDSRSDTVPLVVLGTVMSMLTTVTCRD